MISYQILSDLDVKDLMKLDQGHSSTEVFAATKTETRELISLTLTLQQRDKLHTIAPTFVDDTLAEYQQYVKQGYSMSAFDNDRMVGIAITEKRAWNNTLWIWEFHVDQKYRRQGIGSMLMKSLADHATKHDFRCIGLEVQSTNVPAIRFYWDTGFEVDSIDLSYYTNTDVRDNNTAIFMKKKLT